MWPVLARISGTMAAQLSASRRSVTCAITVSNQLLQCWAVPVDHHDSGACLHERLKDDASPMPEAAPVTTATLPLSMYSIVSASHRMRLIVCVCAALLCHVASRDRRCRNSKPVAGQVGFLGRHACVGQHALKPPSTGSETPVIIEALEKKHDGPGNLVLRGPGQVASASETARRHLGAPKSQLPRPGC